MTRSILSLIHQDNPMNQQPAFRILFFFLLAIAPGIKAQYTTLDLTYGNTVFQKDFMGQLNTVHQYKHGRPLQYIGLGFSGTETNDKVTLSGNFIMAQYLPQLFRVNDSITGNISGSFFGLTAGIDCFPKVKAFDFIFSGGLNLGRMKLVQQDKRFFEYRGNTLHRKNMLICPKIGAMTKIYLGKFCITLNAEYMYDLSGPRWKEKLLSVGKPHSVPVGGFNQSGFSFSIGLGWVTPMYSSNGFRSASEEPWIGEPEPDEEW
jgi:hypothetical protein